VRWNGSRSIANRKGVFDTHSQRLVPRLRPSISLAVGPNSSTSFGTIPISWAPSSHSSSSSTSSSTSASSMMKPPYLSFFFFFLARPESLSSSSLSYSSRESPSGSCSSSTSSCSETSRASELETRFANYSNQLHLISLILIGRQAKTTPCAQYSYLHAKINHNVQERCFIKRTKYFTSWGCRVCMFCKKKINTFPNQTNLIFKIITTTSEFLLVSGSLLGRDKERTFFQIVLITKLPSNSWWTAKVSGKSKTW
jgi:hypothetical protein